MIDMRGIAHVLLGRVRFAKLGDPIPFSDDITFEDSLSVPPDAPASASTGIAWPRTRRRTAARLVNPWRVR